MKKYVLTVTLNPAVDNFVFIKGFQQGKTYYKADEQLCAGGKGINVARCLKKLNVSHMATGFLGGCYGKVIQWSLLGEKIHSQFVNIAEQTRMNLTVIDPISGKTSRILEAGPRIKHSEYQTFKRKYIQLLRKSHLVVLAGRLPNGLPNSTYAQLINEANKKGAQCILDTSEIPFKLGIRAKPYLIKPNLKEAKEFFGKKLNSQKKLKQAVNKFHRLGIKIVCITLGKKGAIASDANEMWIAKTPKITVTHAVGAGDAFISGFIYAFLKKYTFKDVIRMATATATSSLSDIRPGMIKRDKLIQLSRRVRLSRI